MSGYSLDLRRRVVNYVREGGSAIKASKIYGVCIATVYNWLKRPNLEATKVHTRRRKIDPQELQKDVLKYPDATIKERAKRFGVYPNAISYALKKHKIKRKKNVSLSRNRSRKKNKVL